MPNKYNNYNNYTINYSNNSKSTGTCNFYRNYMYIFSQLLILAVNITCFNHILRNGRYLLSVDFRKMVRKLECESCVLKLGCRRRPGMSSLV